MANTTVYPFGNDGQLPSSIGIIDDLTTGGSSQALSAEQGVVLKGMIESQTFPIVDNLIEGGHTSALSAEQGKVLYNGTQQNYTKGYYLKYISSGVYNPTVDANWNYTDYIPCSAGESVVWTAGTYKYDVQMVFYDSSKAAISGKGLSRDATSRTETAPADTAYVRVSFTDYDGEVYNSVPVRVGSIDYPRQELMIGNKDIQVNNLPSVINKNLYAYLYSDFGDVDVPNDALTYTNATFNTSTKIATPSDTRVIVEMPIKYGYGLYVTFTDGYKSDLLLFSYSEIGLSQAGLATFLYSGGISSEPKTELLPYGARMCCLVISKNDNSRISLDDAKGAFSAKLIKIPDVCGYVKGINHRGYNVTHPQNTLCAFRESKRQGFNYVETDVRTTSDGVLVLLHNTSINATARNADGSAISDTVNIADITYEQALQYDFGIAMGEQFAGEKIPTLAQFLALCKWLGLHPYLEMKAVTANALVQAVNDAGMQGNVTYLSGVSALQQVKALDATARLANLGLLSVSDYQSLKTSTNEVIADINKDIFNDTTSSDYAQFLALKAAGVPVEIYTWVNRYVDIDPYVSGVTADQIAAERYLWLKNIIGV